MKLKNILIVVDDIEYVNPLMTHSWGQRVIRIYDPDHHVIEIGESMEYVNAKNSI